MKITEQSVLMSSRLLREQEELCWEGKQRKKLNLLRVGPENVPNICSIVEEGCD